MTDNCAVPAADARAEAAEYGAMMRQRDRIIGNCLAADLDITEIARLTGHCRQLVYKVKAAADRRSRFAADDALDQLRARLSGQVGAPPPAVFRAAAMCCPGAGRADCCCAENCRCRCSACVCAELGGGIA